jgi:hypothetical protein
MISATAPAHTILGPWLRTLSKATQAHVQGSPMPWHQLLETLRDGSPEQLAAGAWMIGNHLLGRQSLFHRPHFIVSPCPRLRKRWHWLAEWHQEASYKQAGLLAEELLAKWREL